METPLSEGDVVPYSADVGDFVNINEGDRWECVMCGNCCGNVFSQTWLDVSLTQYIGDPLNGYCKHHDRKTHVCHVHPGRPNICNIFEIPSYCALGELGGSCEAGSPNEDQPCSLYLPTPCGVDDHGVPYECVTAHCQGQPGCADTFCCTDVCLQPGQSFCCRVHWDQDCANLALTICPGLPANDVCGAGSQLTGTDTITLTGGTIPPEGSCTFSVDLQVPAGVAYGVYTNTTSTISTSTTQNILRLMIFVFSMERICQNTITPPKDSLLSIPERYFPSPNFRWLPRME